MSDTVLERCPVCGRATKMKFIREYLDEPWIVDCVCDCEDIREAQMKARTRSTENYFTNILTDSRYQGYIFGNDDRREEKVSDFCRKYVEDFPAKLKSKKGPKGILFAGGTGCGKSFYAGCIAHALTTQGYNVLMTTLPKFAADLGFAEYAERLRQLKKYHLLIIDDWGVERKTEYMDELVQTVIDERYRQQLPVILTTNRTREQIVFPKDQGDHRIISRLVDMVDVVIVKGKDRRMERLLA